MYDMIMGFLRPVVPALVAWAVARGWIPEAMSGDVTKWIIDFGVAAITLGAGIWSVLKNRKSSQIARVAAMSDQVDKVILKKDAGYTAAQARKLGSNVKLAA